MDEPIADEVRGILDGHVVMDRRIAARGHYPAIDVTVSLSRVMDAVVAPEHVRAARTMRALIAAYEEKRDLIALGAYAKGSDPKVDRAIAALSDVERFLCQDPKDVSAFDQTVAALTAISKRYS